MVVQALNLVRSPSSDMICLYCHAGKTNMLFTNVRKDAPWANALFSTAPWHAYPKLIEIKYFRLDMVMFDLMHVWHLRCGRDVACIKKLTKARSLLVATSRKAPICIQSMTFWARKHNKALAMKRFTQECAGTAMPPPSLAGSQATPMANKEAKQKAKKIIFLTLNRCSASERCESEGRACCTSRSRAACRPEGPSTRSNGGIPPARRPKQG